MSLLPGVTVVGSLHTDLIASADRMPELGSSVIGKQFTLSPGGKAANQATQLARLGVQTWLVSAVGQDVLGDQISAQIASASVDLTYLDRLPGRATGASAVITVDGEYASVIVPGAAGELSHGALRRASQAFAESAFVLAQLELGVDLAVHTLMLAKEHGATSVLNASPLDGHDLSSLRQTLGLADVLVMNRYEASVLGGVQVGSRREAIDAARRIQADAGAKVVVVTCGASGIVLLRHDIVIEQDAFMVPVRDTVGAGDAFLGGLVGAWNEHRDDQEALRWGAAAGALCAAGHGAFASLPLRDNVLALLGSGEV